MIMMVRKHPVTPAVFPSVRAKGRLDGGGRIFNGQVDGPTVDQEWKPVVGNDTVVREDVCAHTVAGHANLLAWIRP
jgi:hypothetical protein